MFVHYVAERPSLNTTLTSEGPMIVRLLLATRNLWCEPQWLGTGDWGPEQKDEWLY